MSLAITEELITRQSPKPQMKEIRGSSGCSDQVGSSSNLVGDAEIEDATLRNPSFDPAAVILILEAITLTGRRFEMISGGPPT